MPLNEKYFIYDLYDLYCLVFQTNVLFKKFINNILWHLKYINHKSYFSRSYSSLKNFFVFFFLISREMPCNIIRNSCYFCIWIIYIYYFCFKNFYANNLKQCTNFFKQYLCWTLNKYLHKLQFLNNFYQFLVVTETRYYYNLIYILNLLLHHKYLL